MESGEQHLMSYKTLAMVLAALLPGYGTLRLAQPPPDSTMAFW